LGLPGRLSFIVFVASWVSFAAPTALGQKLSFGVVAGGSITNDFAPIFSEQKPGIPTFRSANKGFLVGPTVEYAFADNFSLEINALNRLLHAAEQNVRQDRLVDAANTFPVATWQFPTLVKYRFRVWDMRTFLTAGPSFRTAGNLNGTNPSNLGVTGGVGVELYAKRWSIAPTIRYTRWKRDRNFGVEATKADQIEALVSFSHRSADDSRPFGQQLSFGVLVGSTLTRDFRSTSTPFEISPGDPFLPPGPATFRSFSGPRSVLIGPTAELRLRRRFSVEASALYRTFRFRSETVSANGARLQNCCAGTAAAIWELPILLKYRLSLSGLTPFVAVGAAFRTFGNHEEPRHGLTTVVGLETHWSVLKIAPQIRYTRWATNSVRMTPADQIQAIVGISF
jgi:hypothetical protein